MLGDNDTACVTIIGEPGVGKTETALQACYYMWERNKFGAIFFADCKEVAKHSSSPFPTSGLPDAHIRRLCQLVSEAQFDLPAFFYPLNQKLQMRTLEIAPRR